MDERANTLLRKNSKKALGNTKELRQMVPRKKRRKNAEENTKTLQKLIQMPPTTKHGKTWTTCKDTHINYNSNR